ncbi:MAG: NUDIX domain-containing protein [Pseudoflavonifractor sp.]
MLQDELTAFSPFNAQEAADREAMLSFLNKASIQSLFSKNTPAHFTVSAWIVNAPRTRVLMAFHNIYRSWSWTGGHVLAPEDLSGFAIRKAKQETGLQTVQLVSNEIYSLEIIANNGYFDKGVYCPSHLHLNLTYLLEADEREPIHVDEQENCGVKWFELRRAAMQPNGAWIRSIYEKLNAKLTFI